MRLEETFTQEEIKEIRNYIDKVNEFKSLEDDSLLIPKVLLIDGLDKETNNLIKDEITSNLKVDVKELNIKNIERIANKKIFKKKTFLVLDNIELFVLKFGLKTLKDLIFSIKEKKNAYLITVFNESNFNNFVFKMNIESLFDDSIDIDYPSIEEVEKYLEKIKNNYEDIFKMFSLEDLKYIFYPSSYNEINKTLMLIDKDYKNNKIKELNVKTIYKYHLKLTNGGKINQTKNDDKIAVAYHEIGHFIMDYELNGGYGTISLMGTGKAAGHYTTVKENNDMNYSTFKDLKNMVVVALGGYASCLVFLKQVCSGAESDLLLARNRFNKMCRDGMFGFDCFPETKIGSYNFPTSAKYQEKEAEFLDYCLLEATSIIRRYKDKIELIFEKIMEKDVLFKQDLVELMED